MGPKTGGGSSPAGAGRPGQTTDARAGDGMQASSPDLVPAATPRPRPTAAELEAVRRRDPQALAAFFERYFDEIYGLVYRLLGERAAAQDMAQEVFLKVHRAASQIDSTRDPKPWLTAIAHNACRDYWRSGAYRLARRSDSIDDDPAVSAGLASAANDPERDALAGERRQLVLAAIQQLPESLRVPVVLYDYQGLNHAEIAALLGIGHAAARKRYSRALDALGELLREKLG